MTSAGVHRRAEDKRVLLQRGGVAAVQRLQLINMQAVELRLAVAGPVDAERTLAHPAATDCERLLLGLTLSQVTFGRERHGHLRPRETQPERSTAENSAPQTHKVGFISWRRGVVASVVRRMNEVTVHWAWLVLEWLTVVGRVYRHGV